MNDRRWLVPFINAGHLLDHLVMLVFPTVVLALAREWERPYSELLPLALGLGSGAELQRPLALAVIGGAVVFGWLLDVVAA